MIPELRVSAARVSTAAAELRAAAVGTRAAAVSAMSLGALGSASVAAALSESSGLRAIRAGIIADQMELAASGATAFLVELDSADLALAARVS